MAAPIILCDTAGMTNEQWLEARMHGPHGKIPYTVGGSDVAAIFGVSPWTTPLELWNIKKGRMKPPKKANANQLEMGHLLEPIAAHWYAKKTGNIVKVDTNLYQHADHSYALANFDRRFTRASDGEPGILECKAYESEVMLTMQRKDLLKKNSIRNAEYYDMIGVQERLYAESAKERVFTDLISIICSDANIKMAYRNLKGNDGSNTPGVDGMTFENLSGISEMELIAKVKGKILNYQPKAVRRVYIPKPNGKKRPLGIPTVIDRIVQQSVLQILEPICEAKFYDKSYGFRPNRNTKNAVAMCYKYAQRDGFHFVVDVDIKGFFDNVNHAKLLKQIWTLGIKDKNLLCLIGKMLKAPIEDKGERFVPDKGTPQGGVLSPLLANIVLNELDWWIASQWEEMPVHHALPSDTYPNKNGTLNKGNLYKKLRQSKLKECHIIRYADDFKIFCKTYGEAVRLKYAVEEWLMDRLKLETSKEKSKITNLKTGYSEFLGIKFKLIRKSGKWVIKSHMTDKAISSQQKKLKKAIAEACRSHSLEQSQHNAIIAYNQMVVGMHEYYNMATMICADVHKIFPSIDRTMKTRLNTK